MFKIAFADEAFDQYQTIKGKLRKQVDKALERISKEPFLSKPLRANLSGIYSERVSTFRILFEVDRSKKEVAILAIEHRRSAYGGH